MTDILEKDRIKPLAIFLTMLAKKDKQVAHGQIERLLNKQTTVILDTVDKKIGSLDKRIDGLDKKFDGLDKRFELVDKRFDLMEKKMERMEERTNKKIDRLTATLDRFLKRVTDIEDEFTAMKADINRLKKIISEKLGVEIL